MHIRDLKMMRKLIFIIIILAIAGFAAYKFGIFNRKTEQTIEITVDKTKEKATEIIDKIKEKTKSD